MRYVYTPNRSSIAIPWMHSSDSTPSPLLRARYVIIMWHVHTCIMLSRGLAVLQLMSLVPVGEKASRGRERVVVQASISRQGEDGRSMAMAGIRVVTNTRMTGTDRDLVNRGNVCK